MNAATEYSHPFERAGLGAAPYRLVGIREAVFVAHPGAPARPGASCDYCGTAIVDVFVLASADGREFKVGCDCVEKASSKGDRVLTDVQKRARDLRRERAAAKADAKISAAIAALIFDDATRARVEAQPHPRGFVDRETGRSLTLLDWAAWMLTNAGRSGRLEVAKAITIA
jgi:hypothetical protein